MSLLFAVVVVVVVAEIMAKLMEPTVADTYGGVAMVSCMWIIMAYVFMPLGPIAGMKKCSEGQQKWGQRSFLNMQEQAVLFNGSLWLYAIFVSAADATDLGKAYLLLRSFYPVVWMVLGGEKGMPEAGSMFTFPQYAICLFQVVSVVAKLGYDYDLKEAFFGYKGLGVFAFTVGFMTYAMVVIGMLSEKVFAGFFKAKK